VESFDLHLLVDSWHRCAFDSSELIDTGVGPRKHGPPVGVAPPRR
jgi:hypothetical protein